MISAPVERAYLHGLGGHLGGEGRPSALIASGALEECLAQARIVGLGEVSHGTREFFVERGAIFRHLVHHHNFRALAIEASCFATERLNDYIHGREGSAADLVLGLGALFWSVEEFLDTIDWMRSFNKSASPDQMLSIHGIDISNLSLAVEQALERNSGEGARAQQLMALNQVIRPRCGEGLFPRYTSAEIQILRSVAPALSAHAGQCERRLGDVLELLASSYEALPDEPGSWGINNLLRSRAMAKLLLERLVEGSRGNIAVWAHNFHVGVGAVVQGVSHQNMGSILKENLQEAYVAIGAETSQGSYLGRRWDPEKRCFGPLEQAELPVPPEHSLPGELARHIKRHALLRLRPPSAGKSGSSTRPRRETIVVHSIPWAIFTSPALYGACAFDQSYDAMIYLKCTSATTPTVFAAEAAAKGEGH